MNYPASEPLLWPDEKRGPWLLVLHWDRIDDRVECVGVEVTSDSSRVAKYGYDPKRLRPRTITTEALRLPIARIVREKRGAQAKHLRSTFLEGKYQATAAGRKVVESELTQLSDRSPRSPAFLLRVAERYVAEHLAGGQPTKAVAEAADLGGPVARSTAANWVAAARAAGFLTKGKERQPGGRLTAKAERRLAGES